MSQQRCPACGKVTLVYQDIEAMSNAVALTKIENRIQLTCMEYGWLSFTDPPLS